jgi:SsrA-binding protein
MGKEEESGEKVISTNRKARHDYHVLETFEAGIALTGTEVKSLREGNATISEGYAQIRNGEVWLLGVHISPYKQGSYANVEPLRERKLLLHKKEIRKLFAKTSERGVTLVPLRLYFKRSIAKLQLGVCRGKKEYDRREDIKRRDTERALRRTYAR